MKKIIYIAAALAIPVSAIAQVGKLNQFIENKLGASVDALITVLIALATLVFIWGIISYIAAGGDETKMKTAKSYIIFSIIGLALILGIWGVAQFLVEGLGFNTAPSRVTYPGE